MNMQLSRQNDFFSTETYVGSDLRALEVFLEAIVTLKGQMQGFYVSGDLQNHGLVLVNRHMDNPTFHPFPTESIRGQITHLASWIKNLPPEEYQKVVGATESVAGYDYRTEQLYYSIIAKWVPHGQITILLGVSTT